MNRNAISAQIYLMPKKYFYHIPETCGYRPALSSIPENPCSKACNKYFPLISMMSAVLPNGLIVLKSSRVMFSVFRKKI